MTWLEPLSQDIRYAFRMLRRNPGFTAIVVLTLGVGIGMNTAVFSVVNAVLLRPMTYPDANRLVWLCDYDYKYGFIDNGVSPAAYALWRDQAHSFEKMLAYGNDDWAVMSEGESTQERIATVTDDFWSMTGARPEVGRLFTPRESNTMVLSHALFERRFGCDPHVIGKTVTVDGYQFTISGVLPKEFRFLFPQEWRSGNEWREIDAY